MHKHIPERWDQINGWYFVTVVTKQRIPFFESESHCQLLLAAFRETRKRKPFRLGALVILHDHWHGLLQTKENTLIEYIIGDVKEYTFHTSRKSMLETIQWQPRFLDHRIRNEEDYFQHVHYIQMNPSKHGVHTENSEKYSHLYVHSIPFLV